MATYIASSLATSSVDADDTITDNAIDSIARVVIHDGHVHLSQHV